MYAAYVYYIKAAHQSVTGPFGVILLLFLKTFGEHKSFF